MMFPPGHFDANEWFILVSLPLLFGLMWFKRNKFPLSLTLVICLMSISTARLMDHLLAGPVYDMYDVMDLNKVEYFDMLTYVLSAPFAYFLIYFFEEWRIRGIYVVGYILAFALMAIAYEWTAESFQVFQYKSWNFLYSFTFYLWIQPLTLALYMFLKKRTLRG